MGTTQRGDPMCGLTVKLKNLKPVLRSWVKEHGPNLLKDIASTKRKLNEIQDAINGVEELLTGEKELLFDYQLLCDMEIFEMKQKAEEEWLLFGDKCSKYFHKFLKAKRNHTVISQGTDIMVISKVDRLTPPEHLNHTSSKP